MNRRNLPVHKSRKGILQVGASIHVESYLTVPQNDVWLLFVPLAMLHTGQIAQILLDNYFQKVRPGSLFTPVPRLAVLN